MQRPCTISLAVLFPLVALSAQERGPRPRPIPRIEGNTGVVPPRTRTPLDGSDAPVDRARAGGSTTASAGQGPRLRPTYQRLRDGSPLTTILARERMGACPTRAYWERLPLLDQIQLMARSGFIPADPFPTDKTELTHWTMAVSGWRAYGFLVPPGGAVRVDLSHPKPAWFRVFWTDKWGEFRPGMKMSMGEPSCLYENGTKEVQAVFCMVDDPGLWSTEKDPYTLKITRSFDPSKVEGILAVGIWATPPPVTAMH